MSRLAHGGRQSLRLLGEPRDVHVARAFLRKCLADLGIVSDDCLTVVSELVTNAVVYGRGPIQLQVEVGDDDLLLAVSDRTFGIPTQRHAGHDDELGRGLAIVDALTTQWWVETGPDGKTVHARMPYSGGVGGGT